MNKQENSEICHLKELLKEQEVNAKMLVRRDLELTRTYEKLQDLERMKSEFVSVVAHQLRTPLSVTKWALSMLEENSEKSSEHEQQRIIELGIESNEQMIKLVDDLLKVDLHEVGKIQYSFSEVSIIEIIKSVLDHVSLLSIEKEITVKFKQPQNAIPKVKADSKMLGAVIQNLVENSLKYTPKGGVVTVRVKKEGNTIVVSVKDTGIGISKEEYERVFMKFYRGKNAVAIVTNGSGLGLFIARKIVKRHGGDIWFESKEGEGTTFYFSIPIIIRS